eukprot:4506791-Prymnesium_polylepis.2
MCESRCVKAPAVTQLRTWVGNSLQTGDLGVLEGGCEGDHARRVFAIVGEVVISQAEGKWKQTHGERFQKCDSAQYHACGFKLVAQYLSWRRCSLPLMQAPMMMVDAMPSWRSIRFPERSIESTGLMPFSSSIGSGWPSTLQMAQHETHLRVEIWESLTAAARAITPDMSWPLLVRLLPAKLQASERESARSAISGVGQRPLSHTLLATTRPTLTSTRRGSYKLPAPVRVQPLHEAQACCSSS